MQLDADEDGEPFFKPPVIAPAPIRQLDDQQSSDEQPHSEQTPGEGPREGETEQAAAATATVEQEE